MKSEFEIIPTIGVKLAKRLNELGYYKISDLKGVSPEELFFKDCIKTGTKVDRCVLYVYRLAVYYAENEVHEDNKLKWWYWKD